MAFFDRLADRIRDRDTLVSVGLDPDPDRLPDEAHDHDLPRWAFTRRIVDRTHRHAAAFKPNAAFYEDPDGWRALEKTVAHAREQGVPVLLDAKRADIGNTSRRYADLLDLADAITVNPYLGEDALSPFLSREDAGVFVLCRTSNPGGGDLQKVRLRSGDRVYEHVAGLADDWADRNNVGLVVGATATGELERVRELVPGLPFLVPGVGAQGGDVEAAVEYGPSTRHPSAVERGVGVGLVNSTRGIIFAGEKTGATGLDGYARAAEDAAMQLKQQLNRAQSP